MCTNLMLTFPNVQPLPGEGQLQPPSDIPKLFVSARCLEMPGVIEQSVYVVAVGENFPLVPAPFPVSNPLAWTNTQGFVGIAPSGSMSKPGVYSPEMAWDTLPTFNDGINSAGLSIGALWLALGTTYPASGTTSYPEVSFLDFPAWVLGNCTTAAAVQAALLGIPNQAAPQITVVGPPSSNPYYVPLHYVITDNAGASIIVEFVGGQTNVYSSPNGVLTNAPTYDWHLTDVNIYEHLTSVNDPTSPSGEGPPGGCGLMGLPGDPTSASRFIKAWYDAQGYSKLPTDGRGWLPAPGGFTPQGAPAGFAYAEQTAVTAALQLVQLCMGTPYGMLVERVKPELPAPLTYSDFTMWTSVRDHTNANYYFMSAFSGILTKIDLSSIDFTTAPQYPANLTIAVLPQAGAPRCVDVTDKLQPATD